MTISVFHRKKSLSLDEPLSCLVQRRKRELGGKRGKGIGVVRDKELPPEDVEGGAGKGGTYGEGSGEVARGL